MFSVTHAQRKRTLLFLPARVGGAHLIAHTTLSIAQDNGTEAFKVRLCRVLAVEARVDVL